jgi:hypothetical protein
MTVIEGMDLSGLSLRQLRDRRRRIARQIPDLEVLIAGSLQAQRRRCGKEGCRCARGVAASAGARAALAGISAISLELLRRGRLS